MAIRFFLLPQMKLELMGAVWDQPAGTLPTPTVSQMRFCAGTDQIKTLSSELYGKGDFEMEMDTRLRYLAGDEQVGSMILRAGNIRPPSHTRLDLTFHDEELINLVYTPVWLSSA